VAWAVTTLIVVLAWASLSGPGTGKPLIIEWPAGLEDRGAAAERAEALGLVRSRRLFSLYLLLAGAEPVPGQHLVNDALSPRELVQRLARLPARPAVKVTLPEGFTHLQMADRLEKAEVCGAEAFRRAVRDKALLAELSIGAASAEGYLFPSSYELAVDSDPAAIVRLFVRELRRRLERIERERSLEPLRRQGFGIHEVLTLASIIEKETGNADERPLIASVFFNRLKDPAFLPARTLQSDPTAAYGCAVEPERAPSCSGYDGRVTPAMLRDALNRYNTYRHPGLPPGPIANPGEAAIIAVLAPARSDYLFFVARGDGRHTFTRTFAEHDQAVKERVGPATKLPKP
jgi:UPF0755 protein